MSSLKVIKNRIRSVSNTKKITQTMRLVSAAKYARAERELLAVRPAGQSPQRFFELAEILPPEKIESQLVIALSGDRGLCGAIHSGIAKAISAVMEKNPKTRESTKLVCIGEKNRIILSRFYPENILWVVNEVGKKSLTFMDAGKAAHQILKTTEEFKFSRTLIYYNKFVNASVYAVSTTDLFDRDAVQAGIKFPLYDEVDDDTLTCWLEFGLVTLVYWMMKEGTASELSARMIAMENATKNASEMIKELTLLYNRTRQAVITKELIEIISGASAVEKPN
ncbi:ATP synthase subunit gamma, mitochondrial-like [Venturia canescens]|uniref:ATP synthase subunit gamma, mitochondrial-like n=1 Tax=Venturia canescens TaxID=32260 RepID=UPI001C9CE70E|nr:ATP synthase subunit gamma, mitochondrial-like [Venturia canescens]